MSFKSARQRGGYAMAESERLLAVLVTGSGSGIGAAICRRLARPGVGILVHALSNEAGCRRVAAEVEEAGGHALVVLGDLSRPDTGAMLVERAVAAFGGLDQLIANAGFPDRAPFGKLARERLDYVFDVVTGGFFEMTTAALPYLRKATCGRVVAISTHNVHVYRTDYPWYPASATAKAGLEAMSKTLAMQLAPSNVTVNVIAPGLIEKEPGTEQFLSPEEWQGFREKVPLGRIGTPDDVAGVVQFLCSRAADYITGQVIHVNGGLFM
ncbi:MAG: SDR family oxidoreductase [Methylobacteriaceae bacterium]|nr:SDR family oxidoreductase [Methylobacteriaceae bacterium]